MMEKYEDKNDLVFPHVYHVCLTGRINNSFVWIRRKQEDIKQSSYKFTLMLLLDNKKLHIMFLLNKRDEHKNPKQMRKKKKKKERKKECEGKKKMMKAKKRKEKKLN